MTIRHKRNACEPVQPNRKDMPHDYEPKQPQFKRGYIMVRNRRGLNPLVGRTDEKFTC
jgi:hypothetical protein